MKITIAGAGAMGCRFGAALSAAGHQVLLLDGWAEHVSAINAGGLRITDEAGTRTIPVPAVLFPAPADPADLVIVFAKATATAAVAAAAAGSIGPSSLLLTLQNGLGNMEALRAYAAADRLLAGTTTLGTELAGPGHIRALGSGETVLGPVTPPGDFAHFTWPHPAGEPPTVGETLRELMAANGWPARPDRRNGPATSRRRSSAGQRSTVVPTSARPAPGRPGAG